ncbi:MAG: BREX-3 system phosphatase PglZ [Acidobacteria bacterium]|nr:BREX-3 system phosphatase PglZ [Acidobacteriota bacterium]
MNNWRDEILKKFTPGVDRLTVVADPDGLLQEEAILETLQARGFELVSFEDRIAFRFFYESRYRSHRDRGDLADLVVAVRGDASDLRAVPYDVLQAGHQISFQLGDLFPKLSGSVVNALDRSDLDCLYAAQAREPPARRLGEAQTEAFVLRHLFRFTPETIKAASDLLRFLLRRHYRRLRLPRILEHRLIRELRKDPVFERWPLAQIVPDRQAFFAFLQERWPIFLDRQTSGAVALHESTERYGLAFRGPAEIPFDHPDVRVYIDNLFLEGVLRPIAHPGGEEVVGSWALAGIEIDPKAHRKRRLDRLLKSIEETIPKDVASHQVWLAFAPRWAQVNALVFGDAGTLDGNALERYRSIRDRIDEAFTAWIRQRFETLHNLPPSPPVMIHQIPRLLARRLQESRDGKVALVVMDGLALDQWVVVHELLAQQRPGLRFREESLFAWIPTLTMVSRQACFTGRPPLYFATSIDGTDREPSAWKRFWGDEGLPPIEAVYEKNLRDPADVGRVEELVSHPRARAVGLVVDVVDRIMHGMTLGSAGMHNQVELWTESRTLAGLLDTLLDRGFAVFLTSDHGNVEARGCGAPREKSLAELRGQRARIYRDRGLRSRVATRFPDAIEWPTTGLPEDYFALLAPGRRAFVRGSERPVAHGGITLEEVVVPFVEIERK